MRIHLLKKTKIQIMKRTFRVVLEAEDARLFSSEEKVVIGKE